MRTATKDLAGDMRKQLAELVRSRVPNARAEEFVQRFYANVPPDDLLRATSEQLYGAALAMWQWGQHRKPGAARVRVYSPDSMSMAGNPTAPWSKSSTTTCRSWSIR